MSSDHDHPWLPLGEDLDVQVAADAEDWGSSDTVHIAPGQQEAWTLTQDDQGLRFR